MRHDSSFRDPSGYVFIDEGIVKRSISPIYFSQFDALSDRGIFDNLIRLGLLIPHKELSRTKDAIILQPEQLPFVSYPYEWSFNQYKEAALLTLKIQKYCLEHGFSLKDASAFNITFHKGKAIFFDTLSFDFYIEDQPWRAYKQFVMHFLGPLVLAHYHGSASLKMLRNYIDGVPVDMLASLLPFKSKLNPFLYTNIHLLAKYEAQHNEDYSGESKLTRLSKSSQLKLITAMYDYIRKLELKEDTEWGNYYEKTNYSDIAFSKKSMLINEWVNSIKPETLIDVGGNDGTFVRELQHHYKLALVGDIDNNAVDLNYKQMKQNKEHDMLPLVLNILDPSPAIGFNNKERDSLVERIQKLDPDMTFALALIHHISLSGNVPFELSAHFFASFSKYLIIEFPKRQDSWVQRLLNTKGEFKAHFDFYGLENFKIAYAKFFDVIEEQTIEGSERVLFLLKTK